MAQVNTSKVDAIENAIWDACDEGTFEYGANAQAIVAEMVVNVLEALIEYDRQISNTEQDGTWTEK